MNIRDVTTGLVLHCAKDNVTLSLPIQQRLRWKEVAEADGWGFIFTEGGWLCPKHYQEAQASYRKWQQQQQQQQGERR